MTTKSSAELTLKDRLSRLQFLEACKLLGEQGKSLIQMGGRFDFDLEAQVYLGDDLFRVRYEELDEAGQPIVASITLMAAARARLRWNCTACDGACIHVGGAFALALEEKLALGLAAAPKERVPIESLSEEALVETALAERAERAKSEKMSVVSHDPKSLWTDYLVTSELSGKSYRVALRGPERGDSYCSCPDFRINTLGTCKHILQVLHKSKRKFKAAERNRPYRAKQLAIHLRYDGETTLRLETPAKLSDEVAQIIAPLRDQPIEDLPKLFRQLKKLEQIGQAVTIFPDAEEYIQQRLFQQKMQDKCAAVRRDPHNHPLRKTLLKVPLLPYQLDGIAFAAGMGRAVLADDMGLGKTIQGVGVAEFLAREAGIRRVLVICPTSLKSQWRGEIEKFCDRDCQLVVGSNALRGEQYQSGAFFTICNYEQVLRDILAVEQTPWDLIILDEGQRIKNWEAKTTRVLKGLKSKFALVLSGTPLENRLEELYSVVSFIDDRRLGPGFRFFNRHRAIDDKGKVLGYKNLAQLRENLKPILLRRTRDSVQLELPPRTIDIVRITPTDEQRVMHQSHLRVVSSIVRKPFISEMDLLRLRQALLMCRMAADSSFLVTKEEPAYSSKLDYLDELIERLMDEEGRKVVLFSEWTTMLNLIEPLLTKRKIEFVRLDGSVPQKLRPALVQEFQTNPECRFFLTTNAGSTGLNLQAANTVINVDLPWNPAVLEQRIARAHRMGQTQPVQVFVLVTEQTIEENLLRTLSAKKDLALAALDSESETDEVEMVGSMDELKGRLEVLLGAQPIAPLDESLQNRVIATGAALQRSATPSAAAQPLVAQPLKTEDDLVTADEPVVSATAADGRAATGEISPERRERVAAAGGELLGAAFKFLGELVAQQMPSPETATTSPLVHELKTGLAGCVEEDAAGRQRLTVTLPDRSALDSLANALAQLLSAGKTS